MSHLVISSLQLMQFWIDHFYKAQMIFSKTGFLALNDLWSWPISSRSFSHDFAIKPLKYIPSCCVHSTARTVLDNFHIWHKWSPTCARCVACNDLWPWPISSRPFNHDFAIKLLTYGTSSCVCCTAHAVLDGFFPYFCVCLWEATYRVTMWKSKYCLHLQLRWGYPSRSPIYNV